MSDKWHFYPSNNSSHSNHGNIVKTHSGFTDCIDRSQHWIENVFSPGSTCKLVLLLMRDAKIFIICCYDPLAHFLSWAAVLCPRAPWPHLVWALVPLATSVKSWILITQTLPKPNICIQCPRPAVGWVHIIFYYDYYNQKKKKIMKIYSNL